MTKKNPVLPVDNVDWLKSAAISMVVVGHIGYFFIDDAQWWSVFGRMAAPVFFFLMGYARSRTIPLHWLLIGFFLTLLDSWNTGWHWVAPNILFSLALIRVSRPHVLRVLQQYGWFAFTVISLVLLMVLPVAGDVVDYGAEGWLWALFGLCQRMYVDGKPSPGLYETRQGLEVAGEMLKRNWRVMRLPACLIAVVIYVWQEQVEFEFSGFQLTVVALCTGLLAYGLGVFVRGPSRFQPPQPIAVALRWLGRHTLEIYVIQLAGSEIIINLLPDLAP